MFIVFVFFLNSTGLATGKLNREISGVCCFRVFFDFFRACNEKVDSGSSNVFCFVFVLLRLGTYRMGKGTIFFLVI